MSVRCFFRTWNTALAFTRELRPSASNTVTAAGDEEGDAECDALGEALGELEGEELPLGVPERDAVLEGLEDMLGVRLVLPLPDAVSL